MPVPSGRSRPCGGPQFVRLGHPWAGQVSDANRAGPVARQPWDDQRKRLSHINFHAHPTDSRPPPSATGWSAPRCGHYVTTPQPSSLLSTTLPQPCCPVSPVSAMDLGAASGRVAPKPCFTEPSWFGPPNHHRLSGLSESRYPTRESERGDLMFLGAWCGQMSVGGWVLMGLLWVTFLGLVLWTLSRLFVPPKSRSEEHTSELQSQ